MGSISYQPSFTSRICVPAMAVATTVLDHQVPAAQHLFVTRCVHRALGFGRVPNDEHCACRDRDNREYPRARSDYRLSE